MKHPPRPRDREAIKAWNRQKIIDAAIAVINTDGIAGLTIARVVELAEVSMGLVNLHFESKERMLEAALRYMATQYNANWRQALELAPEDACGRVRALVLADLDPVVMNPETLGVWYAFRAQARTRSIFVSLVGSRDDEMSVQYAKQFERLNLEHRCQHDPDIVTRALIAILEGIWTEYFLYPKEFDPAQARAMLALYLEALYPVSFGLDDQPLNPLPCNE